MLSNNCLHQITNKPNRTVEIYQNFKRDFHTGTKERVYCCFLKKMN